MLLFDSYKILNDYQSRKLFNSTLIVSQVFGVSAILCVIIWIGGYGSGYSWSENPEKQFHLHPTFMGVGPIFLLGEAILIFRMLKKEPKNFTKTLHVVIHSIILIIGLIALKAVWDSHDYHRDAEGKLDPLPNLYSFHSWIGLFLFVSFCIQYVLGFFSFYFPKLTSEKRRFFLPFHQLFGLLLLMGFTVTALMGITEFAAWKHTCWTKHKEFCGQQFFGNLFGLCILGYTSCVVFIVVNPRWKRLSEEENLQLMSTSD